MTDSNVTKLPCPTCTGATRETVGMVCPTCGTDYGCDPAEGDEQRREATHVVDRDGNVWFLCPEYDGGMATRATAIGPISAGINWLEAEAGPLLPFDPIAYRRSYPRAEL